MTLDYSIDGMQINMSDYIKESWNHCHQAPMANLPLQWQITCSQ